MYYFLLIIFPLIRTQSRKEQNTIIMQSINENYHYDLIANYQDYQNADYKVQAIVPINTYAQNYLLPNYTITDLNTLLNSISFPNVLIGAYQYNLKLYPVTLLLSNVHLIFILFQRNQENEIDFQTHKDFDLQTIEANIKTCTMIYGLFDEIINIDCHNPDLNLYFNIVVELQFDEQQQFQDVKFTSQRYSFKQLLNNQDEVNQYWSNCQKKEIKYINHSSKIKRIFYCISNQLMILQDQLILIEDNIIALSEIEHIIEVYSLNKSQFNQCNNEQSVEHFYLQQLIVNSITSLSEYTNYETKYKWIFSLLLIDRYGICKCGNLQENNINCDFLELQSGQYTTLYAQSYSEEIQFIFVATEILLYKINYYFNYQTDQDNIEGYFYIKQDSYQLTRIHIFYDFLLVIMTDKNQSNELTKNQRVLFFQKKYNSYQYLPNFIVNQTTQSQIYKIDFDRFPGNYYLEYNTQEEKLSLHKLSYKYLTFSFNQDIEKGTYLLYQVTLKITSPLYVFEDILNLVITKFNDPSFFALPQTSQQELTFKSEQFNFNLNDNLIGPLLNYHEIEWLYHVKSTSLIEYIREIKIESINDEGGLSSRFTKIFSAKFVYNEVNALFSILGTVEIAKDEILLGYQQFKYEKTSFEEEGKLKILKLENFSFKSINFVSLNVMTILIGDQSTNTYAICYQNEFSLCSKLGGDFLIENKFYDYVHLNELRCINDTLFVVPQSKNEVIIFSLSCLTLGQNQIDVNKIGTINSQIIIELHTEIIIDYHFEIIENKLSFILLSGGTIVQLVTHYSISNNRIEYQVINRIHTQNCVPLLQNTSKIFIQCYQSKRVLVYLCNQNEEKQIITEYDLQNPYNPEYIRKYALYQYVINNQLKPFNDQTVIYLPVQDRIYLAYSPFCTSPNILLHAIPIPSSIISAVPVIVNNYNTDEWNIFSMAFFYDNFGGTLFYLNSNPVYYSSIAEDVEHSQQMIMIYQQIQDFIIFQSYNVSFDYQETKISCSEKIIVNESFSNKAEIRLDDSIITGAVQDIDIIDLSDQENVIIQKIDILQLKQYVGNHFQALEFGKVFDILDMNQTEYFSIINWTAEENNLIFAVSQYYLIILEKQCYKTKEIDRIVFLKHDKLSGINPELVNLKQCKLSINAQTEVLLYCYKYHTQSQANQISKFALYYSIRFEYDLINSSISYKMTPIDIQLGRRAQIETISPIQFKGQIFQFLQYNFENSQDQYELICGKFVNGKFQNKQIIQSSTFDYKILGQLSFDITLLNEDVILVLTLDMHELRVLQFIQGEGEELIKSREERFSYSSLNETLFNSSTQYKLETVNVLECKDQTCLILLGVPEKFFEFHLQLSPTKEFEIIKQFTYLNYFRCVHSNKQKPQIELRNNLQINQLVASCFKSDIEKNFFFEDKFDYFYDDILVFVQIFHRPKNTIESSPIRIYPFFFDQTTRERFHFILYIRQSDDKVHILFENDTYFLIDYLKQDSIYFVIQTNKTISHKITGNIVLSNIRDKIVTDIEISYHFETQSSKLWLYFLISGILLIVLIIFGILMCLKVKKQRRLKKSQLSSKSFIDLDDVLKEVILGEGKRGSQTQLSDNNSENSD